MALDPKDVTEDGIHTGVTGPPNDQPSPTGRHEEVTTSPKVVIPVSDPNPDATPAQQARGGQKEETMDEEQVRERIRAAEQRDLEEAKVGEDRKPASTRTQKPGNQR